MHTPAHFSENRLEQLIPIVQNCPLATLVTSTVDSVDANHIPMLLDSSDPDKLVLRGHTAKANPIWQQTDINQEVLAIFQGNNGYISPNWYPSKQQHGKVVPTWNYSVVHFRGSIRFIHDGAWLLAFLQELTQTHESQFKQPWKVSDAPEDYTEKLVNAIVGFEIQVTSMKGNLKLSQNKPKNDHQGAVNALSLNTNNSNQQLAKDMQRQKP